MIKHIPNALTLLNLFFGCMAIAFVFQNEWNAFLVCTGISALADLLDGMVARKLGVDSPLGVQLDSLADAISFGVSPGMLLYVCLSIMVTDSPWMAYMAFLIPVSSILRLAKFNLDTEQRKQFLGLPTPANTILVIGFVWLAFVDKTLPWMGNFWIVAFFILVSCFLMLSRIPLLKFSSLSTNLLSGRAAWLVLISACISIYIIGFGGFLVSVFVYILLSLFLRSK